MAKENAQHTEFFGALESLRGIAALMVVLYHIPHWDDRFWNISLIRSGHLMVDFFFVLSGFVLFHSYGSRLNGRTDLEKFVALRFARLYPVHLTFTIAFVIIELGKYIAATKYGFDQLNAKPVLYQIIHATVENLFLVQGLGFTDRALFLNFPSWSISTEFYTYLVFGIGLWLLPRRSFVVAAAGMVVSCVAALLIWGAGLGELGGFLRCLAGFFLGCLTYLMYERFKGQAPKRDWAGLVLAFTVIVLCSRSPVEDPGNPFENLAFPLSSLLIFSVVLSPAGVTNRALLWQPLRWLGEISYSLYMSHALALYLARHTWARRLGDGAGQSSFSSILTIYSVTIVATLVMGWLTYRFIEDPCRRIAKARVSGWFTRAAARTSMAHTEAASRSKL